jgi:hypothetical protein
MSKAEIIARVAEAYWDAMGAVEEVMTDPSPMPFHQRTIEVHKAILNARSKAIGKLLVEIEDTPTHRAEPIPDGDTIIKPRPKITIEEPPVKRRGRPRKIDIMLRELNKQIEEGKRRIASLNANPLDPKTYMTEEYRKFLYDRSLQGMAERAAKAGKQKGHKK